MRIIDPTCTMGNLATTAESTLSHKNKFFAAGRSSVEDIKLWRLYAAGEPCAKIISAPLMEVHNWNKNARAFAAWQASLGRIALPVLEFREEDDPNNACMWKVTYKVGGIEDVELVCAESKAEARREFNKMARVTWIVKSIDKVEKSSNDKQS